ncbi:MAG: hypothetical protein V4490_04540 [Pseudomonadota bacterium]
MLRLTPKYSFAWSTGARWIKWQTPEAFTLNQIRIREEQWKKEKAALNPTHTEQQKTV